MKTEVDAMNNERMLVWFSCGAASAVAAKVTVEAYGKRREVVVMNVDMGEDEHPDNRRFLGDVEKWIGQEIIPVRSTKYSGLHDVFLKERYIAGIQGASCTKRLKRDVQKKYAKDGDTIVIGMTVDERERIELIEARNQSERFMWVLADCGITKDDCYHILQAAGIKLPDMYLLGFNHANCMGCVKGGQWHWNKVRKHFPERFNAMAAIERELGYPVLRTVYLDELDPNAGRRDDEPNITCGLLCEGVNDLVPLAVEKLTHKPERLDEIGAQWLAESKELGFQIEKTR